MTLRRATAIVVTRGEGASLEALVVRRSPRLRFFGGYHAFPGGVIDPVDREIAPDSGAAEEAELASCAIREVFEETGLWLSGGRSGDPGRGPVSGPPPGLRERLLEGDTTGWREHFAGSPERLPRPRLLGELTKPAFAPVRYQTTFFVAEAPDGFEPSIIPGELVSGGFRRPADAVAAWRAGEIAIAPPVLFALQLMAEDPAGFAERFRRESEALAAGRLHPIRFTPGFFVAPLVTDTKPPATTTNTAVIGEERLWVLDPAPTEASERERLLDHLRRAREAGAEVAGVLATHHHPDHVGAVDAVCREFDVRLHAHPECLVRLDRAARSLAGTGETAGWTEALPRAVAIEDGSAFELGTSPDGRPGWSFEAIATPGHAPDHLAFLENRYRAVAAGDLLSGLSTVVIDPPDGHLRTYERSLDRLRGANPGTIVPGHGPAFPDGSKWIGRVLEHRKGRERKVLESLDDRPREVGELLSSVYDDVPPERHDLAARTLEACLLALAEEGRAKRDATGWIRSGA